MIILSILTINANAWLLESLLTLIQSKQCTKVSVSVILKHVRNLITSFLLHLQLQEYFKCDITGTMINKATFQKPVSSGDKRNRKSVIAEGLNRRLVHRRLLPFPLPRFVKFGKRLFSCLSHVLKCPPRFVTIEYMDLPSLSLFRLGARAEQSLLSMLEH